MISNPLSPLTSTAWQASAPGRGAAASAFDSGARATGPRRPIRRAVAGGVQEPGQAGQRDWHPVPGRRGRAPRAARWARGISRSRGIDGLESSSGVRASRRLAHGQRVESAGVAGCEPGEDGGSERLPEDRARLIPGPGGSRREGGHGTPEASVPKGGSRAAVWWRLGKGSGTAGSAGPGGGAPGIGPRRGRDLSASRRPAGASHRGPVGGRPGEGSEHRAPRRPLVTVACGTGLAIPPGPGPVTPGWPAGGASTSPA